MYKTKEAQILWDHIATFNSPSIDNSNDYYAFLPIVSLIDGWADIMNWFLITVADRLKAMNAVFYGKPPKASEADNTEPMTDIFMTDESEHKLAGINKIHCRFAPGEFSRSESYYTGIRS